MSNDKEEKKGAEKFSAFMKKAAEVSKKTADTVAQGAKDLSEKIKEDQVEREKNKAIKKKEIAKAKKEKEKKELNPLLEKDYKSANFHVPNIIVIVDDAVRRDIKVCKGAIGWRSVKKGTEVLYLYDECTKTLGIRFIPEPVCGEVYYMDRFDRKCFVRTEDVFRKAHEERVAELEKIAYSLGAKSCSIEIVEEEDDTSVKQGQIGVVIAKKGPDLNSEKKKTSKLHHSGKKVSSFTGSDSPKPPILKWFKDDENMKGLIEMRCSGENGIKKSKLELKGASTLTMSQKTACAIDAIKKVKASASMEQQFKKEHNSTLIFEIEF